MAEIRVKSFAGLPLNDANTVAYLDIPDEPFGRVADIILSRPFGKHPIAANYQPREHVLPLYIQIKPAFIALSGGDPTQALDIVTRFFNPGAEGDLVVEFQGADRFVTARISGIVPYDRTVHKFKCMLLLPDPRWRSVATLSTNTIFPQINASVITDAAREEQLEHDGLLSDGTLGIWRATTNLCTNGGAETNTTGWTSAMTLARGTSRAKFGAASFRVTPSGAANSYAGYAHTFGGATVHSLSAWVYLSDGTEGGGVTAWDGGNVSINGSFYTSAVQSENIVADGTRRGEWQRISCRFIPDAGDLVGFVTVDSVSNASSSTGIWFDGVQIEAAEWPTPYVETDGGTAARTAGQATISAALASARLDESAGAVAFRARFGFQHDVSVTPQTTDHILWEWYADANNYMRCWYDASADLIYFDRVAGGVSSPADALATNGDFDVGEVKLVICAWTATSVSLYIGDQDNAGVNANTGVPDLSGAAFSIGEGNTTAPADMDLLWMAFYSEAIVPTDIGTQTGEGIFDVSGNVLKAPNDLTRAVWSRTSVTASAVGEAQDRRTRLAFSGRAARVRQVSPLSAFAAGDVWTGRIRLRSETRTRQPVRLTVGAADASESTSVDLMVGPDEQTYTASHTYTGSGTGVALTLSSPFGGTPTVHASSASHSVGNPGAITPIFGGPSSAPPGSQFIPPGGLQDPGPYRAGVPGPHGPGDVLEVIVQNVGNTTDDQAVINLTPTQGKAASDYWTRAIEMIIANRSASPIVNYAVDVGDTFNHAFLVSSGHAQADGDDLRILVDGVEVPRWIGGGGWNTTTARFWCNLDFAAGKKGTLQEALTASSDVGDRLVLATGEASLFDDDGYLVVDNEVIQWEGKSDDGKALLIKSRGARTTTAATHSVGALCYWVEHQIQIVYGYSAATAPEDFSELQPVLDLANSSNTSHRWGTFRDFDQPRRSMQWSLQTDRRDTKWAQMGSETESADEAKLEITYRFDRLLSGDRPGNSFYRPFPVPYRQITLDHNVDPDLVLEVFGTDDNGEERLVYTAKGESNLTSQLSADLTAAPPTGVGSYLSDMRLRVRQWLVIDASAGSATDGAAQADGTITNGTEHGVPFEWPDWSTLTADFEKCRLRASSSNGGGTNVSFYLATKDADGNFVQISDATVAAVPNVAAAVTFTISGHARIAPGTLVYLVGTHSSAGHTVTWFGANTVWLGQTEVQGFDLYSVSMVPQQFASATPASDADVDNLIVDLDTSNPSGLKFVEGPAKLRYFMNGTIENLATGQQITINALLSEQTGTTVEIDMKNRTVLEKNGSGDVLQNLLPAATFSDPDNWMLVKVGANDFTYAEDGLVELAFDVVWRNVWL